jgi:hypothetical protein
MANRAIRSVLALVASVVLVTGLATSASADPGSRPFTGSVRGEVTFTPVPDSECPPGGLFYGGLRTDSSATGTVSHLGRTVMSSRHCTPVGDLITGGHMTLVSASGDEVDIEYSGSAPFPIPGVTKVVVVSLTFEIVGGSGRFEGADGGGTMTAHVVFEGFEDPVWPASWTWSGSIGY